MTEEARDYQNSDCRRVSRSLLRSSRSSQFVSFAYHVHALSAVHCEPSKILPLVVCRDSADAGDSYSFHVSDDAS